MHRPSLASAALAALCLLAPAGCNDTRTAADDTTDATDDTAVAADAASGAGDTGIDDATEPGPGDDVSDDDADDAPGSDASGPDECIPYDDTCPDGTYCQYVSGALRCVVEGDIIPDPGGNNPDCPAGTCSRGGICMPDRSPFATDDGRLICYQPCDATQEREETGCFNGRHTCWPAFDGDQALTFGLCAY